jgi:hypothetical protein
MICQGIDGLLRGDFSTGAMTGSPMLSFIPLHLSALQHSTRVLPWVQSWCSTADIQPLSPNDWFERGHGILGGNLNSEGIWMPRETQDEWMLWTPPPGGAPAAIEGHGLSRHKRNHINHLFVCPRLLTQYWWRCLHRIADIVIEISAGARFSGPHPCMSHCFLV